MPRYSLAERLRLAVCLEEWNIGIVDQRAADIVAHGLRGPIRWRAPPEVGTFLADPSCRRREDGGLVLYAEHFSYAEGRGEIWSADVKAGEDPLTAQFRSALSEAFHLSYPFPFSDEEGGSLLIAESWQAGGVHLWREIDGELRREKILLAGRLVVDPTLWRAAGRWWLFCTLENDEPNGRLHLFHAARIGGPWIAHPANPVKSTRRGARPAGPLFAAAGLLVRPGQDCSETYGGAVILHAVRRLDPEHFEEEEIRRLAPQAPYGSGLHTFCPAGDVTLIDGRRWSPSLAKLQATALRKAAVILGSRHAVVV